MNHVLWIFVINEKDIERIKALRKLYTNQFGCIVHTRSEITYLSPQTKRYFQMHTGFNMILRLWLCKQSIYERC